jgi:hypothetical protein
MSTPKITALSECVTVIKGSRATAARNKRRNELAAQKRRQMLSERKCRNVLMGLGTSLSSAEAQERSRYLDSLIHNGKNFIR